MGVAGQRHTPDDLPPEKSWYLFYRRLGEPQGRSGWARKNSTSPGFDPRNVQPIATSLSLATSYLGEMQNKAVLTNLRHYPVILLEALGRITMSCQPSFEPVTCRIQE
jgi:hypothetical protein